MVDFFRFFTAALLVELLFILFCIVATVQLFYYTFFFSRLAFFEQKIIAGNDRNKQQALSVLVCARDEAKNLVNNLPGILVQAYGGEYEVIVVNDNSVDETKYILLEFSHNFPKLQVINLEQESKFIMGKKFPLSMAIKSAKNEILLLTDADCVPATEHWMNKMQSCYNMPGVDVVLGYGAYHKKPTLLNRLIRFETFHTALQYLSYALAGLPYMGVGRNLSYKRQLFIDIKGFSSFNKIMSGDDDLFINRVANKRNTTIMIDHDTFTLSAAKGTWKSWMQQKYRHCSAARHYKLVHKILLSLYNASLFLFYPLFALALVYPMNKWWDIVLYIFSIRLVVQTIVLNKSMKKLNEHDLFPFFLFFDIWMFFYYLCVSPAVWKNPRRKWN